MIGREIPVLDHGYVALDDVMGDDRTAARCARTSFRNKDQERTEEQDERLVDYLIRNKHNTPLEFCQLRFYVKMPISVARQLVRQRTQSINEISLRYVKATREYYVPAPERMQRQSTTNKQGSSSELVDDPETCGALIRSACETAFDAYEALLEQGLAKELARTVLPLGTYTEWFTQMNLHNFFYTMGLRLDAHAQYETRTYADAMLTLARGAFPKTVAAWERHRKGL
jgi:thymidylate synthase (FAD)